MRKAKFIILTCILMGALHHQCSHYSSLQDKNRYTKWLEEHDKIPNKTWE